MKIVKKLLKVMVVFLGLLFVIFMLLQINPSIYRSINEKVDDTWLMTSLIRITVIAGLIIYLPRFYLKKSNYYQNELMIIQSEYDQATASHANYESLKEIENKQFNVEKLHATYQSMSKNKHYIALFLVLIEIIAVQIPHFL